MASPLSGDRLRFLLNKLRERLWVKPLAVCLLSIGAAFVAKFADGTKLAFLVPEVDADSIETLLSIMASSMLVIATFSVSSMVAAFASASNTATPRSFSLVVSDDPSQNALSTFVGAFIFSIIALTAAKNHYFEAAGLFILFALTVIVFAIVIMMFVRWVDRIARLGRIGSTIEKVESATAKALKDRRDSPNLCGVRIGNHESGKPIFSAKVGYVQHIDVSALQEWAKKANVRVEIAALPGTFASPSQALAFVRTDSGGPTNIDCDCVIESFEIGRERLFDDDPRFGLIVLSEIASRALSPAVNDPGTAISIIGTFIRLFNLWEAPSKPEDQGKPLFDRIEVPELSIRDMFDDAFTGIARDGAGAVEVSIRLQKALSTLAEIGNSEMKEAAEYHAKLALKRAEKVLDVEEDLNAIKGAGKLADR